jgi:hypothetical protein
MVRRMADFLIELNISGRIAHFRNKKVYVQRPFIDHPTPHKRTRSATSSGWDDSGTNGCFKNLDFTRPRMRLSHGLVIPGFPNGRCDPPRLLHSLRAFLRYPAFTQRRHFLGWTWVNGLSIRTFFFFFRKWAIRTPDCRWWDCLEKSQVSDRRNDSGMTVDGWTINEHVQNLLRGLQGFVCIFGRLRLLAVLCCGMGGFAANAGPTAATVIAKLPQEVVYLMSP